MDGDAKKVAELLKVLANENRLIILCELIESSKTVGKLSEKIPKITLSALSQHLTLLKAFGILKSVKTGQNITYSIADHRVEKVIQTLKDLYCSTEEPDA